MNEILKRALKTKKPITFFSTKDSRKKSKIVQNFFLNKTGKEVNLNLNFNN
jgi:hypothetical protein